MKDTSTKKPKGRPKKTNTELVEEVINDLLKVEIVTTETFKEVARHDWNSEDEVGQFLASLVRMSKYKTILEVGVFEGETTQHLIKSLPKGGQYVGIDINDYRTDATKLYMAEGGKSIDFILGNSHNELGKLPSNHFDLIFVDGDHSWASILPEFKLVEKLVSRGGVIVYHDTIHLSDPKRLVEYAAHYNYNTTTLNTPEGRGISLISKY
jgi:predicted O-methyltransferase YrrM